MMEFEQIIQPEIEPDLSSDLDLIEILWRQDADLGVSKEVFDPNLRRELEQERELELLKEQEKRKEAEKRERERQQQAHQWLAENFIRDGETGEWIPIAGSGRGNTSNFSHFDVYPEPVNEHPITLEEALNFLGELQINHTYEQQHQQSLQLEQQTTVPVLPSNLAPTIGVSEDFQLDPENFLVGAEVSDATQYIQNDERLENSWQEVVSFLSEFDYPTVSTPTNSTVTMPPVDTQPLVTSATDAIIFNQSHIHQPHHQQLNANLNFNHLPEQNQNVSSANSMNEIRHLLSQNSTSLDAGNLSGILNESSMLLNNVSLQAPILDNSLSALLDIKPLVNETGILTEDFNASRPTEDTLTSLDWESGELFFPNITDLNNLTNAIASSSMLDANDILTGILPGEELDMALDNGLDTIHMLDDGSSDSAISMGSSSPQQEVNDTLEMAPFNVLEGATGGSDYDTNNYGHHRSHTQSSGSTEDDGFHYSCSSYGSPASVNTNCSTGSNDTEHSGGLCSAATQHVHHNHTYPTQPGQTPREVKKYMKKDGQRQKGPQSRDAKRVMDLKIPFTYDHIVECAVEEFNDMLTKTKLNEAQINLMRDIRRRGKNKVAAQNCRKRKLDVLVNLEDDTVHMQRTRDKLAEERRQIDLETRRAKEKYSALYQHIFRSLRDEHGRPYNPDEFSLQQSSDGNVFLVCLTNASAAASTPLTIPLSSSTKNKNNNSQKKNSKE